jgi:hypothetical protein
MLVLKARCWKKLLTYMQTLDKLKMNKHLEMKINVEEEYIEAQRQRK